MEKKTRFVRTEEAKADTGEQGHRLAPYTNSCQLSVKAGNSPEQKTLNGYQVVTFTGYHWQPKSRPQMPLTVMVYDGDLQETAKQLAIGQSLVVSGKLGYDVHNGVAKLFVFADRLSV
jgi:hypothetical protein